MRGSTSSFKNVILLPLLIDVELKRGVSCEASLFTFCDQGRSSLAPFPPPVLLMGSHDDVNFSTNSWSTEFHKLTKKTWLLDNLKVIIYSNAENHVRNSLFLMN